VDRVVIVPYDPLWVSEYERERRRLLAAFGEVAIGSEHVGSTAIPGLRAKPVVDIMVGVRGLGEARSRVATIEALGYAYVPAFEQQIPERLFFRRGEPRTHHLHVVEPMSAFWEKQLLFRDYLRVRHDVAERYGQLKDDLASKHGHDRDGYTRAKTDFILAVLEEARAWRTNGQRQLDS
jgi:GrpB-like predicted nucleotidyltransferase (UPF0157 family)